MGLGTNEMVMCFAKMLPLNPFVQIGHAAELVSVFRSNILTHPVVFLYFDGGPDHRVMYNSVKLALIARFRWSSTWTICVQHAQPHTTLFGTLSKGLCLC